MISINTTVAQTPIQIVAKAVNATRSVLIYASSHDLYIGPSNVTSSTGFQLRQHQTITVLIPPNEELWAITSAGTHSISTLTNFVSLA